MSPLALLLCRLPFLVFCLATGIYAFIAYVPVLYEQFIRNELFPWVPWVVKYHRFGFLLCLLPVALTLRPLGRRILLGFTIPAGLYGFGIALYPLLPGLQSRFESLLWCLFWFLPPFIVGILDLFGGKFTWERKEGEGNGIFLPAALASVCVTLVYFAVGTARGGVPTFPIFAWSFLQHLFLFSLGAAWVTFALSLGGRFKPQLRGETFSVALVVGLALTLGIRQEILGAFSYFSLWGFVIGATGAASILLFLIGLATRLANKPVDNGLSLLLLPFTAVVASPSIGLAVAAVLLVGIAYAFPAAIYLVDWNFLMQRLSAAVAWAIAFGGWYGVLALRRVKPQVACVPAFVSLSALLWATPPAAVAFYWGHDPSLQVASELLRPPPPDLPFYSALRLRTDVAPEFGLEASPVRLVDKLTAKPGPKPPVFIFVVDSLRRDYVGAFNPKSPFTPRLDAFAKDGVAFTNAFTQYGGTGLSEPSLWVGGLVPHRFYVSPFHPLNSLQQLLEVEGYRSYVSLDSILSRIVSPWPKLVELDYGIPTQKIDFCRTLKELEQKLSVPGEGPTFVYTQAQNLHISLPKAPVDPKLDRYQGFFGPYAAALERVDSCFGNFVDGLKAKGQYDESLIVVAADHGDSLGEEGRFGHSYNLFPEVVRIPLLVHLPKSMRATLQADPSALAFLTDVTPSLYYLLGHEPIRQTPLTGRPLFTHSLDEQKRYRREHYLLAASYGAVFGILSNEGKSFYIADGVNRRDYGFEDGVFSPPTAEQREKNRRLIDEDLNRLARFFPSKGGVRLGP